MTPHTTTHWCLVLRQKRHIDTLCYDTMTPHTITSWHLILRNHATSYCDTLTPRTATHWHLVLRQKRPPAMTPWHLILCMTPSHMRPYLLHLIFMSVLFLGAFGLHELILCVSEGEFSVGMRTFGLPLWTDFMCVGRYDFLVALYLQCGHENMGTYDPHGLILCVPLGVLSVMICNHIVNIDVFSAPF